MAFLVLGWSPKPEDPISAVASSVSSRTTCVWGSLISRDPGCWPTFNFSNSSNISLLPKPTHISLSLVHSSQLFSWWTPSSLGFRLNVTSSKEPYLTLTFFMAKLVPILLCPRMRPCTLPSWHLSQLLVSFYLIGVRAHVHTCMYVFLMSIYLTNLCTARGQCFASCYALNTDLSA